MRGLFYAFWEKVARVVNKKGHEDQRAVKGDCDLGRL